MLASYLGSQSQVLESGVRQDDSTLASNPKTKLVSTLLSTTSIATWTSGLVSKYLRVGSRRTEASRNNVATNAAMTVTRHQGCDEFSWIGANAA